ncbi:hypothetical protein H1C71_014388, partial [Ictidomys tridecemlineatus]
MAATVLHGQTGDWNHRFSPLSQAGTPHQALLMYHWQEPSESVSLFSLSSLFSRSGTLPIPSTRHRQPAAEQSGYATLRAEKWSSHCRTSHDGNLSIRFCSASISLE